MRPYQNAGGDAGIIAYDYGPDWIQLQFRRAPKIYTYRASGIGAGNLAEMKRLADAGDGLTTYLNMHPEVRDGYEL